MFKKTRSWSWSTYLTMTPFDGKCLNLQKTPTHFFTSSYRFRDKKIKNIWPSKSWSRSQSKIFAMTTSDGKCQNLQKTPFCASSYCFRDINILIVYLKKVGKVQGITFSQWHPSMVMSKSTKDSQTFLRLFLPVQRFFFEFFNLRKVDEGQSTVFAMLSFDGKCQSLQRSSLQFLC